MIRLRHLLLPAIAAIAMSCTKQEPAGISIQGSIDKELPATAVVLSRVLDQHYDWVDPIDTLEVTGGAFSLQSDTLPASLYALTPVTDQMYNNGNLYLFLGKGTNKVTLGVNKYNFLTLHAEGTDLAERYQAYVDGMAEAENRPLTDSLTNYFNRVRETGDMEALAKVKEETDPYFYKSDDDRQAYIARVIEDVPSDLFGLYLYYTHRFTRYTLGSTSEIDKVRKELEYFDAEAKESPIYERINKTLTRAAGSVIGATAPDFSGTTKEGEMVALKDLRGRYVLVDFWSSTCTWCRAETPHIRKVYDAFAGDRFTVLGVSQDTSREPWIHAMEEDSTTWPQILLDRDKIGLVNRDYNVQGIPLILLIDPEGKILARDLRGEAIYEAVEEALSSSN